MAHLSDDLRKDLTPAEFELFRDWIHQHSGIYLEESKTDSLRISLVTRATRFGFTEYDDYFRLLSNDEEEFKELMNLVTINETSFFRFPAQFEAFRDRIIPEIVDGRSKDAPKRFRVWSAGCSTGEEPYTIAMTTLDSTLEGLGYTSEVVGTDVSTQALDRARKAIYPDRAVTNLSSQVMNRFFEPAEGGHRPVKRVRDLCAFHYHNLIKDPYPLAFMSNWDVIFCRNVTIYFRIESTRRVVNNYFEALNPGGYLFIGHSETLTSVSDRFEPVEIDGVFLYRKPRTRRVFSFDDIVARKQGAATPPAREVVPGAAPSLKRVRPKRERVIEEPQEPEITRIIRAAHEKLDQAAAADALKLAEQALGIDPNEVDAHLVAAFAYLDMGRLADASEQANAVLSKYPLTAAARYVLGLILQQQGDAEAAMTEFKRTVYIDRDFVLAHFALANLSRQQGDRADASRSYQNTLRALHANPDGSWRSFLGGFDPELLARTCERSLVECGRGV